MEAYARLIRGCCNHLSGSVVGTAAGEKGPLEEVDFKDISIEEALRLLEVATTISRRHLTQRQHHFMSLL